MIKGKKLLVLGGKPIGSIELVKRAKELGTYVIVTDYLSETESPAKRYADEIWNLSTADVVNLVDKCRRSGVDGILTAVHEFNINRMIDLCELLNLPCYCKRNTWNYCDSKVAFKQLCVDNEVPVAKKYEVDIKDNNAIDALPYPIIVKPVDGSGSRGFKICHNSQDFKEGYNLAQSFSPTKSVLIEDYIPYDSVIIHYTMNNGKCYFSGISDKYSSKFPSTGASVMGLQLFPSRGINEYKSKLDSKVCSMYEGAGFTDGPIWIEAFFDGKDKFIFNEMGYRFGGSLTNYPVKFFYDVDQLDLMIHIALGENSDFVYRNIEPEHRYCILPIHINPGYIDKVEGVSEILKMEEVYAFVPVHLEGDNIQNWGSAQQVFAYLHVTYDTLEELKQTLVKVLGVLKAFDSKHENLLFTLFKLDNIC